MRKPNKLDPIMRARLIVWPVVCLAVVGAISICISGWRFFAKHGDDGYTTVAAVVGGLAGLNAAAWVITRTATAATKSIRSDG